MQTVCIVSARFYPQVVGSGTAAYSVAKGLAAAGHKVIVITDYALKRFHKNHVLPFSIRYVHNLEAYATGKASMQSPGQELYEHIKDVSPDILQVCNFMPMFLVSTYRNLIHCPVIFLPYNTPVIRERSIDYYSSPELDIALARFIVKISTYDQLIAGSKAYYKSLISLGAKKEKIKLSYLGIELNELQTQLPPNKEVFQEYFGNKLLPNETYLILPSRITKQKGIMDAIHTLEIVNRKHNIKLLLTGMHEPFDTTYANNVAKLARELSIADKVIEPLKEFYKDEVRKLGKELKIVPSLYEGLGLSAIEAQALGVPLVASDTSGLNEVVTNGINGLTSPPQNPQILAECVGTLLEDQSLAQSLSRNGLETVKKFDISHHTRELEEIYEEVVKSHHE